MHVEAAVRVANCAFSFWASRPFSNKSKGVRRLRIGFARGSCEYARSVNGFACLAARVVFVAAAAVATGVDAALPSK